MPRKHHLFVLTALIVAVVRPAGASDDLLTDARQLAVSGHRAKALALLSGRLTAHPSDSDARLLYGITLSWEGRHPEARVELEMVLASNPDYLEARLALINVELWSGKPERAEQLARLGLDRHRENTDLLAAQARALGALGRVRESVEVLDRLLVLSPGNRDARRDRDIASDGVYPWTARLEQSHEWFTSTAAPWNEYRLEVKRGTAAGPVLARFSRANRFQKNSSQAEVDWYPRIRRGTYGYMSLGYSYDAVLYPRIRAGLELYQALPWTTEVSGGYRRLGFDSPVSIYTASVSKYSGKWLCGGRLYVVPGAGRSSVSVQASVRRYLGRHGDYWGVVLGRGSSPAGVRSTTDLGVLNSNSGYFEVQKLVARHWIFGFRGGAAREDRVDFPPATRGLLDVSAAIRF